MALDKIRNAAAAARRNVFIGPLPSSSRWFFNCINTRAALPIRPVPKGIHELLQCRRAGASARNDVRSPRQLAGTGTGRGVRTPDEFRAVRLTAADSTRDTVM